MNLRKIIKEEINKGYYIIEDEDGFMLIHYEDLLKVEPHLYKILKYLPTVDFDEARDLYYKFLNNQITESEDDMEWIRRVPSNPLTKDQYVLIWFDREITKNDLDIMTQWWHEIHGTEDLNNYANYLKRGGYIRFSMDWNDDVYDFGHGTSRTIFFHHVNEPGKYIQYNLSELIPSNFNESEENDWDWAINSEPLELQDPREWIGKSFGYGQPTINIMNDYEIRRGDDKATYEILDVEGNDLILWREQPYSGLPGGKTKCSISVFINQINHGSWVWV